MNQLIDRMQKVLVSEEEIQSIVKRIAAEISRDYAGSVANGNKLVLVCILKGSIVFMGDLMKNITLPVEIDCMRVSSYRNSTRPVGSPCIMLDLLRNDLDVCDLLIIEDIVDSGNTLDFLIEYLKMKGARSVKTCTLLDKPCRRRKGLEDFHPDYVGCEIEDYFVVGYGLDFQEEYRALPYVGVLKPEIYANA